MESIPFVITGYPVYFPLEIEVMCKQFIVEDVVEGETVSNAKIIYPRFDRLSPTAIPWLQRSVLEINRRGGAQYEIACVAGAWK